ncbi:MAG: indolepyruvate oxidoreductase subunit beta [Deferribacteraceae bacterium]|jgi:indolepyruvate ferredoxin oxidoreductase beta subunit|nr:indolepyruvate oxidoreductase subunit beta [Deferribacteraceae bacterium]
MNDKVTSFLMAGVGGQGIVLASNVFCIAAVNAGYDVKKSEIHGMAQRGGSVVSHIRFGKKVWSPVIPQAGADFILSFERMEYLRYISFIGDKCALILNSKRILPPGTTMGTEAYPDELIDREKARFTEVCEFDADAAAQNIGNIKTAGLVMLGKLAGYLNIDEKHWVEAVKSCVPEKLLNINLNAFKAGRG